MKPEYEKILNPTRNSFLTRKIVRKSRPLLSQAWHFHPEIEICLTYKSKGVRYVGNNISDYLEGDLVMLGSNLPHGFTTDNETKQFVLQFDYDFLGDHFFSNVELRPINQLITRSNRGISFYGKTSTQAFKRIKKIMKSDGFDRLMHLFKLLILLSNSNEYKTICSKEYSNLLKPEQLTRVKKVFQYIEDNFKKDINIESISREINLTESAFYKFVKKHTKKKFTQLLNEFRVNHASKLLIESDKTISEICYESGYNNLSYFNRKFKEILQENPRSFRQKYNYKTNNQVTPPQTETQNIE